MLNLIFFSLFSQLAVGALLPVLFISRAEIGAMFFRFMSILLAALLALACWAHPYTTPFLPSSLNYPVPFQVIIGLLAMVIGLLLGGAWLIERLGKFYFFLAFLIGLLAIMLSALRVPATPLSFPAFTIFSFVGSALLLGTVTSAMITGHWYLVNRRLSIQPLRVATLLLLGATILRAVFVLWLLLTLAFSPEAQVAKAVHGLIQFSGQGWLFWLRVAVGLLGPAIFGGMIYAAVKIRSTQSATGMLYAAVVMVFLGEAFAKFLWLFTGIPV